MHKPIITSLLDTDAYKLNMQQAIFHHYPDADVVAEFHCRSDENLVALQSQILFEIRALSQLRFQNDELTYLKTLGLYKNDYLNYLSTFSFNPHQVNVSEQGDKLAIRIEGKWLDVILWEVPLLAIICELRSKHRYPNICPEDATRVLKEKLVILENQSNEFQFVDFGTRRRFSKSIHHAIVNHLKTHSPHFVGTSNLWLAKHLGIASVGTQAHEWFQAHQQLADKLENSQRAALNCWLKEYPDTLGIALTDCINMDAFLNDFTDELSNTFTGLRHDSGCPISWGEKAITHYKKRNIDPRTKTLVFSDSLTLERAVEIYLQFKGRIKTSFGIGTQLTCNIPSVESLNVVIKLTSCNGNPVAKISDEPAKSICRDPVYLSELKKAFNL